MYTQFLYHLVPVFELYFLRLTSFAMSKFCSISSVISVLESDRTGTRGLDKKVECKLGIAYNQVTAYDKDNTPVTS